MNKKQGKDFSNRWNRKQLIQVNDFPIAFNDGCQYLFEDKGLLYLSQDGQYCATRSYSIHNGTTLCIYSLPQWNSIQHIKYQYLAQILGCYFSADNQIVLLERQEKGVYFYHIHNLLENKGKEFSLQIPDKTLSQFWATKHNQLNLIFRNYLKIELYQIDENYKLTLIKSIYQPYSYFNINRMYTLEGTTCINNLNLQQKYLTNSHILYTGRLLMHMNQFVFMKQNKTKCQTNMKHIASNKNIRIIIGDYACGYTFIKQLFIYQEYDSLKFYDFSRGQLVYDLKGQINNNIEMLRIMGDYLALKLNGYYIGWHIK